MAGVAAASFYNNAKGKGSGVSPAKKRGLQTAHHGSFYQNPNSSPSPVISSELQPLNPESSRLGQGRMQLQHERQSRIESRVESSRGEPDYGEGDPSGDSMHVDEMMNPFQALTPQQQQALNDVAKWNTAYTKRRTEHTIASIVNPKKPQAVVPQSAMARSFKEKADSESRKGSTQVGGGEGAGAAQPRRRSGRSPSVSAMSADDEAAFAAASKRASMTNAGSVVDTRSMRERFEERIADYVLLPHRLFPRVWEVFIILCVMWNAVLLPLNLAFATDLNKDPGNMAEVEVIDTLIDYCFIVDLASGAGVRAVRAPAPLAARAKPSSRPSAMLLISNAVTDSAVLGPCQRRVSAVPATCQRRFSVVLAPCQRRASAVPRRASAVPSPPLQTPSLVRSHALTSLGHFSLGAEFFHGIRGRLGEPHYNAPRDFGGISLQMVLGGPPRLHPFRVLRGG